MTETETPASVTDFNSKIAGLIKAAKPNELVELLQNPTSMLRAGNNNNNNNNSKR